MACCVALVVTVEGARAIVQTGAVPEGLAAEFATRIKGYMATRQETGPAPPGAAPSATPEAVLARRATLRDRTRIARKDAKPGEILFPELVTAMVAIFRADRFALTGRQAAAMALETERPPDNVPVPRVNQEFPKDFGLVSPPPTILIRLPELPEALEYRLIGPHLVLRDIDTNLIVDVAPNVLPAR